MQVHHAFLKPTSRSKLENKWRDGGGLKWQCSMP